jgi:hypothetical protein
LLRSLFLFIDRDGLLVPARRRAYGTVSTVRGMAIVKVAFPAQ